ncbi:hypothetical protein NQZ68_019246 [Dissostichus eleginoides]|nr:hypothetical protein NQZ68_019246 [Dissostichus eleginoides]
MSGSLFEVFPRETQRRLDEEGRDSLPESAEHGRKRPRPSIRSPAGNCLGRAPLVNGRGREAGPDEILPLFTFKPFQFDYFPTPSKPQTVAGLMDIAQVVPFTLLHECNAVKSSRGCQDGGDPSGPPGLGGAGGVGRGGGGDLLGQ